MIPVSIDQALKKVNPNLMLGIVQASVVVQRHSPALWREIEVAIGRLLKRYTLETIGRVSAIETVKETYRRLGKDPSRYRGSAEALARRVLQGKGLYRVNNVVDINNLVSLETLHPVGSYDLGNLQPPLVFGVGKKGQSFKGIGKEMVNIEDLPVFIDSLGPYGSPTSDSERAMITDQTKNILMVIISFTGQEGIENAVQRAALLLEKYAHGQITDMELIT